MGSFLFLTRCLKAHCTNASWCETVHVLRWSTTTYVPLKSTSLWILHTRFLGKVCTNAPIIKSKTFASLSTSTTRQKLLCIFLLKDFKMDGDLLGEVMKTLPHTVCPKNLKWHLYICFLFPKRRDIFLQEGSHETSRNIFVGK